MVADGEDRPGETVMSNPRRTVAPLLLALLVTLLLPAASMAAGAGNAANAAGTPRPAEPALVSLADALAAAWQWLAALSEPPAEDLNTAYRLPGLYEGSHLDPNGAER